MQARVRRRRPARPYSCLRVVALGATVAIGSAAAVPAAGATLAATPVLDRVAPAVHTAGRATTVAITSPAPTTSYYEYGADAATLAWQGQQAGMAGSQGLVILDFGRPAVEGSTYGTLDLAGTFVALSTIETAVEGYIAAYYRAAPRNTHLAVAVGTNNSCGTGQPCDAVICGCRHEPPSFFGWGEQLAYSVERIQAWTTAVKARSGYTDVVKVYGGDDAEPAYDPGFTNTRDVLAGYARAVGGSQPAMVDFGSAETGYWTPEQLFQVASGFKPNVLFPQLYYPGDMANWTSLVRYARARHGVALTISGVLTDLPIGNSPAAATSQVIGAVQPLTGQGALSWTSNIAPLGS